MGRGLWIVEMEGSHNISPQMHNQRARTRLATNICQPRHDPMEQGPTEPHAGRSTFLLSSGGAGGGYY